MTNEQQFEQDLLNIIEYATELLKDLKRNNIEVHSSDVTKTATISMQLANMTTDMLIDLPF